MTAGEGRRDTSTSRAPLDNGRDPRHKQQGRSPAASGLPARRLLEALPAGVRALAGAGGKGWTTMDATMLAVIGTGLAAIGTGVALFAALWRVQGNRFDTLERHMDKRFEAVDERWTERFETAEKMNRERFEAAENRSRERFETAENRSRERFEAMDRRWTERFDMVERQSQATHAAVCALNGRFDDLYRHLLGPRAQTGQPGPAPAAG